MLVMAKTNDQIASSLQSILNWIFDSTKKTIAVSVDDQNLATGASTSAKQDTINTSMQSVLTELQQKTEPTDTQPVSAVSLPLPSGASTSSKQDTGNTSIASIDAKIGEVQASPTSNTLLDRLKQLYTAITGTLTVATHAVTQSGVWNVGESSDYPVGATPITAASGNVSNATASATLLGTSDKTTYITGFEISGSGATLGSAVTVTVTGTITGTLSYTYAAVAGALLGNSPLIVQFTKPIPASATNTNIVVSCPALGSGNTNNTVVAHGYQL